MDYSMFLTTLTIVCVCIGQVHGQVELDPECDVTKGCFYECTSPTNCEFVISWINLENSVTYTVKTYSSQSNFYVVIGFSDDFKMGNDSITGCMYTRKTRTAVVFNAKNLVGEREAPKMLGDEGIALINSSREDEEFTCTFNRLKAAGIAIDRFDLYQPWYLFFAKGMVKTNGAFGYHGHNRFTSRVKYTPHFVPPTKATPVHSTDVSSNPVEVTINPLEVTTNPAEVTTNTAEVTTHPAEVITTIPSIHTVSKVNGCGRSAGCYSDCVGLTCSFIISWKTEGNNAIYILTSNVEIRSTNWIAVGFSNDDKMGDDDVMGCVSNSNGPLIPFTGINKKWANPVLYNDPEIKLTSQKSEDGLLSCTFVRPIASAAKGRFNVANPWKMMFAKGSGKLDATHIELNYHGKNRHVSTHQMKASDRVDMGSTHIDYPLVKAHGSLMIVAWVLLASIGLVVARYYKSVWQTQLFSANIWFQVHRMCMVLAFLFTAIGFIIIFIDTGGYSKICEDRKFLTWHPILGIIVMVLTVLNPIMAIFRPHPGAFTRPLFNWAHWFVGTSSYILGVVNIFFGVLLAKSDVPYYVVYVLAAYAAWQMFLELLLGAVTFFGRALGNNEVYELQDKDSPHIRTVFEDPRIILTKRIILAVHFAFVTSFAVILIVFLDLGIEKLPKY